MTDKRAPYGLIASIAINGLLIGLVAGMWISGGNSAADQRRGPPGDRLTQGVIERAAPDERRIVGRALGAAWRGAEAERKAEREAREAVMAAVSAEPYDEAAVEAAFDAWRAADSEVKQSIQAALSDVLANVSPESRRAIAARLAGGDRGRRGRNGPRGGEGRRFNRPPPD